MVWVRWWVGFYSIACCYDSAHHPTYLETIYRNRNTRMSLKSELCLVAEEVDKNSTLHLRERDLHRGPGQVAEVRRFGRLLNLLLDRVAARVGWLVLVLRRLRDNHQGAQEHDVNNKIKNHQVGSGRNSYFSLRRHRGNKKSFIKFVSSTEQINYFSRVCFQFPRVSVSSIIRLSSPLSAVSVTGAGPRTRTPILSSLREIYDCHKNVSTKHFQEIL